MKKIFTQIFTVALLFTGSFSFGANYWQPFNGKTAPSQLPKSVNSSEFTIFTLDQNKMKGFLSALNTDPNQALEISLPAPDKTMRVFKIWKSPIFEKEIGSKFSDIQTFTAYAVDDQMVTAKLDYTVYGFRAMILDGDNSYLIDPYSDQADGYYAAYYKNSLTLNDNLAGCGLLPGFELPGTELNLNQGVAAKTNGSLRRIYRLAISCTGEYAQAVAGAGATVPLVMAKIASTINRVNGIYEKELSVSMNIINGNESIVYVNPASDPYTCNTNLDCLIGEVQATISNNIGAANYDIGHILATAGGGLAALRAVCLDGAKASGTSSSTGPDNFGTILHEMGHQFGANHTFNSNTGGCNGNEEETNAYEPGSGSTIMSYGGACAPNNVTNSKNNYFHIASLKEIQSFLTTQGSTCGTIQQGTPPIVLPEITDTLQFIPKNTPFELVAPTGTVNQPNAVITYNWEQFDLGNFGQPEANAGDADEGPLFRSYPPTGNRTRIFPTVNFILDNSYSGVGERLPKVARDLNFKLTARSVFQGWGTFNFTDKNVVIRVAEKAKFRVTSPSNNETWNPGEVKIIKWDTGGTKSNPINCGLVNIYLSLDDGLTFPYVIVTNAPNTGSYAYTVYNVGTTKGRIKVQGTGQAFLDIGKGKLTITGTETGIENLSASDQFHIYPNPADDYIQIEDKTSREKLKVEFYNIIGTKVWEGSMQGKTNIPTKSFARGQYLIRITNEKSGVGYTQKAILK